MDRRGKGRAKGLERRPVIHTRCEGVLVPYSREVKCNKEYQDSQCVWNIIFVYSGRAKTSRMVDEVSLQRVQDRIRIEKSRANGAMYAAGRRLVMERAALGSSGSADGDEHSSPHTNTDTNTTTFGLAQRRRKHRAGMAWSDMDQLNCTLPATFSLTSIMVGP